MNRHLDRRDFLAAAAAVPMMVAGRVWAAPKADMRTLVVFLRGAYDAANVVIPVSSSFYYESRPTIAVPRPGSGARFGDVWFLPQHSARWIKGVDDQLIEPEICHHRKTIVRRERNLVRMGPFLPLHVDA